MTPTPSLACSAMLKNLRRLLSHDPLLAMSRKVTADAESRSRYLLTFPRSALHRPDDPTPLGALIGADLPEPLIRHWTTAEVVHLGLDEADTLGEQVRKLYLEFDPETAPEPGLAYLAVKVGGRQALHRYQRLDDAKAVIAALSMPESLDLALRKIASLGEILQVSEAGSARLSLDVSLAEQLPAAETLDLLVRMLNAVNPWATPPCRWPSHVAVGRDAKGAMFVTLYGWPEEPCP